MSLKSILKNALAALVATAVIVPAAQAADLGGRPTSYKDEPDYGPPRYLWTGLYTGLHAGYGWGKSSHTDDLGVTTGDFDTEGFIGGGTLGYNIQNGRFVWGLEADIAYSDINGTGFSGGAAYTTSLDWLSTVRARVGYDFGGWMPYFTGGLAVGEVDASSIDGAFGNSDTKAGWTIGGGLEIKLDRNWSFKSEYLYVDLGDVRVGTPVPITAEANEFHIVRAGINYKF
jgi:outer membrane immunogenic protein